MSKINITDIELLTLKQICQYLKINHNTITSLNRRFNLLPKPIIVNVCDIERDGLFKKKVRGRGVFYSRRVVDYIKLIMKLKKEGLSYAEIAKREAILEEKQLIELLHESDVTKDPWRQNEELINNFEALIGLFVKRINEPRLTYYVRLAKDARNAFSEYVRVNQEIRARAFAKNFNIDDLIEKKKTISLKLSLFKEMIQAILRKIAFLVEEDAKFKEEVISALKDVK